jgi:hypothetical protein
MATDGPTPAPCDPEIFKHGECLASATGSSNAVERWVKAVAGAAKARVDWHYAGGIAKVLHLGDGASRSRALAALKSVDPGTVSMYEIQE